MAEDTIEIIICKKLYNSNSCKKVHHQINIYNNNSNSNNNNNNNNNSNNNNNNYYYNNINNISHMKGQVLL